MRRRARMFRDLAAALAAAFLPATAAQAQVSYGYGSLYENPTPSMTFWAGSGYSPIYTDPTLASFPMEGATHERTAVPNLQPPAGPFGAGDGLSAERGAALAAQPAAKAAALANPVPQPAAAGPQRRTIVRRIRPRR